MLRACCFRGRAVTFPVTDAVQAIRHADGPAAPTYQRLLPHGEHGRVGLQVHLAAAPHRLQTLHRDVLGVAQPQPDQIQHAGLGEGEGGRCQRYRAWFHCPLSRKKNERGYRSRTAPPAVPPLRAAPLGPQRPPGAALRGMALGGPSGCPAVLLRSGRSIPVLGLGKCRAPPPL